MNISVCIDALYQGQDKQFSEAMHELYVNGVHSFEFWGWWDKDLDQIRSAKERLGMVCAALCTRFVSLVDS